MINRSQNEIIQKWPKDWKNPTVSVRCITYNQEAYIAQALDSFLMQETTFPFEIVVHDDASTDRTADIIREYEKKFPKILKPIYETENQYSKRDGSLSRIVNRACIGKYIAFCEGDDFWCDRHKLQKQYEAMEAHPECSLCTHVVQVVEENGEKTNKQIPPQNFFQSNSISQDLLAEKIIANGIHPLQTSSYFLKKSTLQRIESFFSCPGNGDEKILRICLHEGGFYFLSSTMSCYRSLSKGSWTLNIFYNNINGKVNVLSNTIKLNKFFDIYTQKVFSNYIETGNKKLQTQIFVIKKDFKALFSPENLKSSKEFLTPKCFKIYYLLSKAPSFFTPLFFSIFGYFTKIKVLLGKGQKAKS